MIRPDTCARCQRFHECCFVDDETDCPICPTCWQECEPAFEDDPRATELIAALLPD
jgi:hypothetical protein